MGIPCQSLNFQVRFSGGAQALVRFSLTLLFYLEFLPFNAQKSNSTFMKAVVRN